MKSILAPLLLVVAQLKGCATSVCDCLSEIESRYAEQSHFIGSASDVLDVGVLSPNELLVAVGAEFSPVEFERILLVASCRGGVEPLLTLRFGHVIGEGLSTATDGRWWYSVAGSHKNRWGVLFVSGVGSRLARTSFFDLPVATALWLPLPGSEPRGLYIAEERDSTRIIEVRDEAAATTWRLPESYAVKPGRWSATSLSDRKIALASIEGLIDDRPSRVVLRFLDPENAAIGEKVILNDTPLAYRIAAASSPNGKIAIALETEAALKAITINSQGATAGKWFEVTEEHERGSYPRVFSTGSDFTTTWFASRDGTMTLRACSLSGTGPELVAATIGSMKSRAPWNTVRAVVAEGDERRFFWQSTTLQSRRLPAPFSSHALLAGLHGFLCHPPHRNSS